LAMEPSNRNEIDDRSCDSDQQKKIAQLKPSALPDEWPYRKIQRRPRFIPDARTVAGCDDKLILAGRHALIRHGALGGFDWLRIVTDQLLSQADVLGRGETERVKIDLEFVMLRREFERRAGCGDVGQGK